MKTGKTTTLIVLIAVIAVLIILAIINFYKNNMSQSNSQKKGYVVNIDQAAKQNTNFRKVLYTAKSSQLVLMSLKPGEEIGMEVHHLDQFIRIEAGQGKAILNGVSHDISDGSAIVVPEGVEHNIVNTGTTDMKLYTVYSPPDHIDGLVHPTKADALKSDPPYDGKTTE